MPDPAHKHGGEPVAVDYARADPDARLPAALRDRFLTPPMIVGLTAYGLFALTFARFQITDDGLVYFNLLRRFFGEHPDYAYAYQSGSDVWNVPFFLVGKALSAIAGAQPDVFHVTFEEISITVAANAAFMLTLYLGWEILRELALPRGPAVLLLATFGSPLFYSVVFDPSGKHAVDTLVVTAAARLLLRVGDATSAAWLVGLGAFLGLMLTIRFANVGVVAAMLLFLLLRRGRETFSLALACAVVTAILVASLPALRGIPYRGSPGAGGEDVAYLAASAQGLPVATSALHWTRFDPTVPLKMLFSIKRGLFLWTPLTAFSVVGFGLLIGRDRKHRDFLLTLALAAFLLLGVHSVWASFWTGGFSFSQRFLTALFPLYLLGTAELVHRYRAFAYGALTVAVAWTLLIAFQHYYGYDQVSERDGVDRVFEAAKGNPRALRLHIQDDAKQRWGYLWGLLHGEDSEHLHG